MDNKTQPITTERDQEMADAAVHRWGFNATPFPTYVEPGVTLRKALANLLAAAREEGATGAGSRIALDVRGGGLTNE